MRISYLGPAGTFSEEAARIYGSEKDTYLAAPTVERAVEMIELGKADYAAVPIENSTEGSVDRSLDVLLKTTAQACGEVCLPIHHQLLSSTDDMSNIREVIAHPQALGQCQAWLNAHLPHARQTSATSNGQAAKLITGDASKAAIASVRAATIYNLHIVAANIEDAADNTTRFLILGTEDHLKATGKDKTTLICSIPNHMGSLHQLLGIFARQNLDVARIESRPATHATWDYNFFIDIYGHRTDTPVATALTEVEATTPYLKVVGSYPAAA